MLFLETLRLADGLNIKLENDDPILNSRRWDGSPIVVPRYKLLFWTIPQCNCEEFKKLFQRIQGTTGYVHDPDANGLIYLARYPPFEASRLIGDPEWTKAVFFRDPFERFLSAFLDKCDRLPYVGAKYITRKASPKATFVEESRQESFESF